MFKKGQYYNRRKDIHDRFGGNRQAGICPSAKHPYIFIFKTSSGDRYGYSDTLNKSGSLNYTGQGPIGDMTFNSENKAILNHQKDGKAILFFKKEEKGKLYQYLGEYVCTSYEEKTIPDQNKDMRKGIIFHLLDIDSATNEFLGEEHEDNHNISIEELRHKALETSTSAPKSNSKEGKKTYYRRSKAVKDYVLARADGKCECCGAPAPFLRKDGSPFLEPHHIHKLSDKGIDHISMVAALTPNCHRKIHHSHEGASIDDMLKNKINGIEEER